MSEFAFPQARSLCPVFSGLVLAGAPFKIAGMTGAIATVGTAENIHLKHFIYLLSRLFLVVHSALIEG